MVATDTFLGVNGTLARSQFTAKNLPAGGLCHLQITGIALQAGRYLIDMADDSLSAITNDLLVAVTASTLSAGIEWIVQAQDPQRTTGVNVDLLDSFNNVVATDTFVGIFGEQAFSQLLVTSLLPGNYTLQFTGNAVLGGRYRIHLTTDATPPGFEPIDRPANRVLEPGSLVLLLAVLGCLGALRCMRADRASSARTYCISPRT